MRPERSSRSRNAALPWPRRACRRPATRTRTSVSSPGSSPSWGALASAIGVTPGYACGNGSTPASRIASSLRRRVASSSEASLASTLCDVDLGDGELALLAARERHLDGVALLAAHERLAHRRLVGEPVGSRVGLGRPDDRVRERLALV